MKSQIKLEELYNKLPTFLKNPNPEIFLGDNYVVLDFETTNIKKGSPHEAENRILFTAWRVGPGHPEYKHQERGECKALWGPEYELYGLIEDIERSDFLVAHFTKFELGWLQRAGLDLYSTLAYCTLIGEYVIAGNRRFDLDLDTTLSRYGLGGKLSVVSKMIKGGICPSEIPRPWLEKYGCVDVLQTEKLFLRQRDVLHSNDLLPVQFTRCIFTNPLVSISRKGMALSKERVEKVHKTFSKNLAVLQRQFNEAFGGVNTNSPKQLIELLYTDLKFPIPKDRYGKELRTDKGNLKTDVNTIPLLKAKTKKQKLFKQLILKITNISSALSKNLNSMKRCLEETKDGIVLFVFNQAVTQTQRLSSNGYNYSMQGQNIARIFKPLFKARKRGWKIGERDYAQLEYRGAVFLGKDSAGIRSIQERVDRHDKTAGILTEAGQPTDRQTAKAHTFFGSLLTKVKSEKLGELLETV